MSGSVTDNDACGTDWETWIPQIGIIKDSTDAKYYFTWKSPWKNFRIKICSNNKVLDNTSGFLIPLKMQFLITHHLSTVQKIIRNLESSIVESINSTEELLEIKVKSLENDHIFTEIERALARKTDDIVMKPIQRLKFTSSLVEELFKKELKEKCIDLMRDETNIFIVGFEHMKSLITKHIDEINRLTATKVLKLGDKWKIKAVKCFGITETLSKTFSDVVVRLQEETSSVYLKERELTINKAEKEVHKLLSDLFNEKLLFDPLTLKLLNSKETSEFFNEILQKEHLPVVWTVDSTHFYFFSKTTIDTESLKAIVYENFLTAGFSKSPHHGNQFCDSYVFNEITKKQNNKLLFLETTKTSVNIAGTKNLIFYLLHQEKLFYNDVRNTKEIQVDTLSFEVASITDEKMKIDRGKRELEVKFNELERKCKEGEEKLKRITFVKELLLRESRSKEVNLITQLEELKKLNEKQKPKLMAFSDTRIIPNPRKNCQSRRTQLSGYQQPDFLNATEDGGKVEKNVSDIFYRHAGYEEKIQLPRSELRLLQEQYQTEISTLQQQCSQNHVTINIDNIRVLIQGHLDGVQDAMKKMGSIVRSIYKKKYTLKKVGIVRHMTCKQVQTKISEVERKNKVVVQLQTGDDSDDEDYRDQAQPISPRKTYTETAMCTTPSGQTIITVVGDITELEVDVIVNDANEDLQHVAGLAKVIVDKGGKSIQKECDDYLRSKNRARKMYDGEIFCSAPGNLNCKMIVHAVVPFWQNGHSLEDEYLSECIRESLERMEDRKYRSIAIPALCTGCFGYPANKATKVIVEAIRDYMKENGASSSVHQIYLCDVKENIVDHFVSAVERFFDKANVKKQRGRSGFVSSPPVRSRHGSSDYGPSPSPRRPSIADSHISVTLIKGQIATQEVDVIVNTTSTSLQLNQGAVSQCLLKMGGPGIQAECSQKYPTGIQPGEVAETSGGKLECKMICHGALPGYNGAIAMKIMETFMKTCLQTADDNGFVSVAFPALGTGNLGYPKNQVAKNMFSCVDRFSSNHPTSSVCDVRFVVYEKDYPTIKAFEEEQRKRQSGEYVSRQTRNLGPDGTTDQDQGAPGGWHQRALADNRQASVDIGDLTLKVYQGDLTEATVDVIVNGTNRDLDLTRGGVSQAILKKGGHELSQLLLVPAAKKEMKREGVATTTAGTNFSCDFIIHINMEDSHVDLKDKFKTVLEKVDELNKKSVALPALGAGISYAIDKVAESLFEALISFQKKKTDVSEVHVVIYEKEKVSQFLTAMQNCIQSQSNQSQGLFSRFKGMLGYGEKKAVSTKQWTVSKMPSSVLNLVVYAKKQNDADSALRSLEESLINDYKEKLIEDTVVKDLTKEQEAKIMKLEETCEVEIEFNRRIGRIKVRGLIENLSEAMDDVHKILRDFDRQRQKQQHAKLVADMVQWYFISVEDTGQKLEEYPAEVNLLLEQALKNNEPKAFFLDNSGNKYIVDFTDYEEYPEDDPSDTVAVLRKSKMTDSAFDMPSNWAAMDQNENIKIVTLQPADKEYQDVVKDFQTNMAGNYNSIVKMEKIQNRTLQQQYAAKKKSMDSTNAKGTNNELKLWHGTAMEAVDSINTYGFNRSYCGKNAVAYGNGVYFAVNPTYSAQAQYARPDPNGNKRMYLCKVLVGEYTKGQSGMKVPPPKPGAAGGHILYDSVVDNPQSPGIVVIFHDTQAYPEYLIVFK
ncbi:protein mono-ADP-ribosyltransferase PARP14-like [Mytilus edulis]|uniref:protein mono-ADP-ribosyltransferase PARP14-like n=1 Tax=Mytilus edulis TaxID=6550 RepID=UPI0039EDFC97